MKQISPRSNIKINKPSACLVLLIVIFVSNNLFAQNTLRNDPTQLLTGYYSLKDALVAGDGKTAALKAKEMVRAINGIDYKMISEGNIKILARDAGSISSTSDIEKQRRYFENLSANMVDVARSVRLSASPVYILYCPMKKASWLNNSKEIENPYYGSSMLTCGNVKDTIQ